MISEKARSICEMVYGLVEEYDRSFEVWEEILIGLVGDHIFNVSAEEWDQRSARFKEKLDRYVGSFLRI